MSGDLFGSLLRLKSEPCQSLPDVDPTVSKRRVEFTAWADRGRRGLEQVKTLFLDRRCAAGEPK